MDLRVIVVRQSEVEPRGTGLTGPIDERVEPPIAESAAAPTAATSQSFLMAASSFDDDMVTPLRARRIGAYA